MDEETSPAAWAADPERADPDDYAPGSPFIKLLTWAPCPDCAAQVHLSVTQFLYHGLSCPRCGTRLLEPPEDAEDWVRRTLRQEDELSEQL